MESGHTITIRLRNDQVPFDAYHSQLLLGQREKLAQSHIAYLFQQKLSLRDVFSSPHTDVP